MKLAEIIKQCGHTYLDRYESTMPKRHVQTMQHIVECRTHHMGGHVAACDMCPAWEYSYHSCKDRHCPQCGNTDTKTWVDKQKQSLLDVPYFHVVFTVPHALNSVIRSNQKKAYSLLLACAAKTLFKVMKQKLFDGNVQYGCTAVLHTWTRALVYHTHVHILVPGGGWDKDTNTWHATSPYFLVPDKALSKVFRAVFVKKLREEIPQISLSQSIWEKDWVVKTFPALSHSDQVAQYLGRYIKRVAITNNRILRHTNNTITFKYQDSQTRQWKLMTLNDHQFLSRYLQHVLPKGFVKVRYYGFMAPANKKVYSAIKTAVNKEENSDSNLKGEEKNESKRKKGWLCPCPSCKKGSLYIIGKLKKSSRAPPELSQVSAKKIIDYLS